jgi:2-(1,2-epoxy-1,2-dihydrophenyl)acetyl-CoA isomerase
MNEATLLFSGDGPVARITFNRPQSGNAITAGMARALLEAATRCDADTAIRCVVLTGAGRLFCAGGDISAFGSDVSRMASSLEDLASTLHQAVVHLAKMRKPLLVLVNGPAAGAGLSLAILGDVVLAARSAHFTAAYGALGLTPDGGMTWLLPRLVGMRKAQEIILTNRRVTASDAEAMGLITQVVDDASLHDEGIAVAQRLGRSATAAFGATRALLAASFLNTLETQLDGEARAITHAAMGPESREGVAAFFAKRKPDFHGV